MPIKILLIAIALGVLYRVYQQYRADKVSVGWFFMWTIFWALVIVVTLVPEATNKVANVVGVGRGADLIIYLSLVLLFFFAFRTAVIQDQQHKELTGLIRKLANKNAKKPEGD